MINFIYKLPLGTVAIGMIFICFLWGVLGQNKNKYKVWSRINLLLVVASILAVVSVTFSGRSVGDNTLYLEAFRSFKLAKYNPEIYRTMMMNIALFFPFGLGLVNSLSCKIPIWARVSLTVLIGCIISILVEFLQFRFALGQCEIDDVICNTFGTFVGAVSLIVSKVIVVITEQKFYDKLVAKYLGITFSVTWICWGALSIVVSPEYQFSFAKFIAEPLHIIGGFGPFIAALIVNKEKLTLKRFFGYKKKSLGYLLIFSLLEIAVFGLSSFEVNTSLPIYLIPLILLQATFIYGGIEELGWRGFMQPRLEEKFVFPLAALVTGIIWSVWHLPLWFVDSATQQNMHFGLFLILGVFLSFWLGAIYKKSKSVICCAFFHGLTNTVLSVFVIKVNWILIIGIILMTLFSLYITKPER